MEYAAFDLHKKASQIRIVLEDGAIVDRRIATTRARLTAVFWGRPRMRIVLEAATESEWVAQHLETLGHEVIVADPNFTPMYSHRSRRIKTDRRDVAALAEACQRGFYRAAHRRSAPQRTVQSQLNIRRELTDSRTRDLPGPGDHPWRGLSHPEWQHRQFPHPDHGARPPGIDRCDARAVTDGNPGAERGARQGGRHVCETRRGRPGRYPSDDVARHWTDHGECVRRGTG